MSSAVGSPSAEWLKWIRSLPAEGFGRYTKTEWQDWFEIEVAADGRRSFRHCRLTGQTSKQSRALADVRLQLKSGKTRGSNPRALEEGELEALRAHEHELKADMTKAAKERADARINAHLSKTPRPKVAASRSIIVGGSGGQCLVPMTRGKRAGQSCNQKPPCRYHKTTTRSVRSHWMRLRRTSFDMTYADSPLYGISDCSDEESYIDGDESYNGAPRSAATMRPAAARAKEEAPRRRAMRMKHLSSSSSEGEVPLNEQYSPKSE